MKLRVITVLAALFLPAVASAAAQVTPLGKISLMGRYDDDLLADGGGPSTLFSPLMGVQLRDPTLEVEASYQVDIFAYGSFGDGRSGDNHRVRATERLELDERTTLMLNQGGQSVYDPTGLSRPGVVRAGGSVLFLEADAAVRRRLTRTLHADVGYEIEHSEFDAPQAVDGTVHMPHAATTLALSPRSEAGLEYRLAYFASDLADGAMGHLPALTFGYRLDPTTRLGLAGGPAFYAEAGGPYTLHPRARAELRHERPRLSLALSGERSLVGAAGFEGGIWADVAYGSAHWRVTEPLTLGLGAAVFRNLEPDDEALLATGLGGEVSLEYRFGDGIATRIAYRHVEQQDRAGVAVDLARNIFAAGVNWEFFGGSRQAAGR